MFLHYILNEESSSLLSRFFKVQVKFPDRDDWCSVIFQDLEYLDIHLTFDQIQASSKQQFKKLIDQSINDKAFQFLIDEKNQLRKVSHIQYNKLTMQNYLKTKSVSIKMAKFIFILHSRMLDISENYKSKASSNLCPVCKDGKTEDTQPHLMICQKLSDTEIVMELPSYGDLFKENVDKQSQVATIIQQNFRKRKQKLKEYENEN